MNAVRPNGGSFRDPAGKVFDGGGKIYRVVSEYGRRQYETARDSGVVAKAIAAGFLIDGEEIDGGGLSDEFPGALPGEFLDAAHILQHPRIPYISHPYEWSFSQLKTAALHHLDFQLQLFQQKTVLSDATAYNIQFIGARPIFIDWLSLTPYCDGQFWNGHRQFCEQFLNPLLLQSVCGVGYRAWFRGALEGISSAELAKIIPLHKKMSWNIISQVLLPAKFERDSIADPAAAIDKIRGKKLSPLAYRGFLSQLRNWINKLSPPENKTVWQDYARDNTYDDDEYEKKKMFVAEFAKQTRPKMLVDMGCNNGDFSAVALDNGAKYVVGFDSDARAVDSAFLRAQKNNLPFLPLWQDAANPSPRQGWRQLERQGFAKRTKADAVIALAFVHHLAIAKNIPLPQIVEWLTDIAPTGIAEFVPKNDSTVRRMLALREDIFDDYCEENFAASLAAKSRIVKKETVAGRLLYWFEK